MANSFNIDVKPEIAANYALIDAAYLHIYAVRYSTLPLVLTEINANETKIDLIRGTDVPNIQTNIDANETKIDANKTELDAIRLKTDATPQKVRGELTAADLSTASGTYADVVNVSGQGKLIGLGIQCVDAGDTISCLVTIDGEGFQAVTHTGDVVAQSLVPAHLNIASPYFDKLPYPATKLNTFNIEFCISLLVQIKRSAGTANNVRCGVQYSLDNF